MKRSLFSGIDQSLVKQMVFPEIKNVSPEGVAGNSVESDPGFLEDFVFASPYVIGGIIILMAVWALITWYRIKRKIKKR